MPVDVTFFNRARRFVCFCWGLIFIATAGCGASATPQASPTPSPAPTFSFSATVAATAVPITATASPSPRPSETPAPSATLAPSATPTLEPSATVVLSATPAKPTPRPTAAEFVPQRVSRWDIGSPSPDNMQGTCTNPITPAYGPVLITPQGDTLVWKNTEPTPYTMTHIRANVWQYSGPTATGDGAVTMVVQFTSATTLQLTRKFVSTAEPNCTHLHNLTGAFQWYQ